MENKPGKIERITRLLAGKQINIRAITIADAGDYGIMKFLLDNPVAGCEALTEAGIAASLKEIIAVRLADHPGSLADMAAILRDCGINVEDAYGFIVERGKEAVFIFQIDQRAKAEKILREHNITLLTESELYMI